MMMVDEDDLVRIRCASCRRTIGRAKGEGALRHAAFCSDWCAAEPPATPQEARNDEWALLVLRGHMTPVQVARKYGVAHSLVYKTLGRR